MFALLNDDGTMDRRLALVSLPPDFQIPEGKMVSWREVIQLSYSAPLPSSMMSNPPTQSFFYFGEAWAEVSIYQVEKTHLESMRAGEFNPRLIRVTVQGRSAQDINQLRDRVLCTVRSKRTWPVRNNFDPKPRIGIWRWIKRQSPARATA